LLPSCRKPFLGKCGHADDGHFYWNQSALIKDLWGDGSMKWPAQTILTWATLRSFGNSRAVQLSVLFPIVGYLILFNDEVARFLSMAALDKKPSPQGVFETLWRAKLYFVYFGLMAMGIGSGIYQVSCPYLIKKYGDWADYVRFDGESISEEGMSQLGKLVGIDYWAENREQRDSLGADIMRNWYGQLSRRKPTATPARWSAHG
jgi:hypothetical protein